MPIVSYTFLTIQIIFRIKHTIINFLIILLDCSSFQWRNYAKDHFRITQCMLNDFFRWRQLPAHVWLYMFSYTISNGLKYIPNNISFKEKEKNLVFIYWVQLTEVKIKLIRFVDRYVSTAILLVFIRRCMETFSIQYCSRNVTIDILPESPRQSWPITKQNGNNRFQHSFLQPMKCRV